MIWQVFRLRAAVIALILGFIILLIWGSWGAVFCWIGATFLGAHLGSANTMINLFRAEREAYDDAS
jgi:hypothetical protein